MKKRAAADEALVAEVKKRQTADESLATELKKRDSAEAALAEANKVFSMAACVTSGRTIGISQCCTTCNEFDEARCVLQQSR